MNVFEVSDEKCLANRRKTNTIHSATEQIVHIAVRLTTSVGIWKTVAVANGARAKCDTDVLTTF